MAHVTDRLDNQIINLAKQQYETQQRTTIPGYVAPLASGGTVYPETSPLRQGVVELRHMTSYDEDILANRSYINDGTVLHRLIDSLMLTPGVTAKELSNPDLDGLIITARINGYGKNYPVEVTDPKTGTRLKRDIDLSKLKVKPITLPSDENGEFEYTIEDTNERIKFKYLNIAETETIRDEHPISDLMILCIREINGDRSRANIESYVKYKLKSGHSKAFRQYMSANLHGMDFDIEFEGEDKDTFTTRFPIGPEILWV